MQIEEQLNLGVLTIIVGGGLLELFDWDKAVSVPTTSISPPLKVSVLTNSLFVMAFGPYLKIWLRH